MTSWLFSLLIGMSSNFDNIGVGLAYGVRQTRMPWRVCTITACVSFLACLIGSVTSSRIAHVIPETLCNLLGTIILVSIGTWTIIQSLASAADEINEPKTVGFSEMMFISLAQGLTDLSIGIGAGFAKLNVFMIALSVGFFSFMFLLVPARLGARVVPKRFGKGANIASGLLLIAAGILL